MNPIEITEEHKSKLLEMCKSLFTKYDDIQISNNYHPEITMKLGTLNCPNESVPDLLWLIDNENDNFEVFHWFEFCVNQLAKKIYTINGRLMCGYDSFLINYRANNHHPIDYLYEQFKKIKQ